MSSRFLIISNDFIKNLLNLEGIELILISEKFISVKKDDKINWDTLRPSIISAINDYLERNKTPILLKKENKIEKKPVEDDKIVTEIKKVLDSKIRPAVSKDGGDIKFISFEKGTVKVELQGSCSGCPSSIMTLKNGVQNLLRHYIPEVTEVRPVDL